MKTYKVKDQKEAGLQAVTYCYHYLIHMVKNDLCYDLYDSDNGWGMGVATKNQNDAEVCALAEILKEEDDEKEEEKKNNDNETEGTDELLKKIINEFLKY